MNWCKSKLDLMRNLLFLLMNFFCFVVLGQNSGASITINLPAKPSASVVDWAKSTPPLTIIIQTKGNPAQGNETKEYRILASIKNGDQTICGKFTPKNAPSFESNSPVKTWSGSAALGLLGDECVLKPGQYQFCVQVFNIEGRQVAESCKPFFIEDTKQISYTAPNLVSPVDGKDFNEKDFKRPITFRWTPLVPKPRDPVVYRLKIWQLMEGQTSSTAIKANEPFVTKDVENLTQAVISNLLNGPCRPPYLCEFVWNVDVLNIEGQVIAKSGPSGFKLSAAGCGSNSDKLNITCGKIVNGIQTYNVSVSFINVAPTSGGQTCSTTMNSISTSTGTISGISSLPVTVPSGGTSSNVNFIYTPTTSGATTATFSYKGNWNDLDNNTSNFSNTNFQLPKCESCDCGSWNPVQIGQNLFVKCGEKTNGLVNHAFGYYPTYNCNPANGDCKAILKWKIEKNGSLIASGLSSTMGSDSFTPTSPGTYTFTINATCGGKVCEPCVFYLVVNDENDCCKNSSWGEKVIFSKNNDTGNLTQKALPACGAKLGDLKCNTTKTLKVCYNCGANCETTIDYIIKTNSGTVYSSSLNNPNCSNVNITSPNANGNYSLTIIAKCNGKVCDTCIYYFSVKDCPTSLDCCKGGYWKEQPSIYNAAGAVVEKLHCPQSTFSLQINSRKKNCDETYTIKNGNFVCATQNCKSQILYTLTNNSTGSTLTGTNAITIAPSLPNGDYTMSVLAICGTDTCSKCSFQIKKECPIQAEDCCKDGKWLNKFYSISAPLVKPIPINIECNKEYLIDYIPNGSITFNADYLCKPALQNCKKQVLVSVNKIGTSFNIKQPVSYSMPLSESGTYKVCYYAICGTDTCETCCFTVKINEKKDCCKGSFWINKSIDWSNDIKLPTDKSSTLKAIPLPSGPINPLPGKSSILLECHKSYKLGLGGTYTFNADYSCPKGCAKNIKVKIEGLTNSSLDGTYDAPIAKTFTIDGNYKITYLAYCGDEICNSCEFYVGVDKNCCLNSKWIKAEYQIVNKKADGSWVFEPGMTSLLGGSVPTLKADLGINIENLNYQCAKGCDAGYIVRRINALTSTLVYPDEILSPGQISTSVYSKPFPQTVVITPTCGGQKCGSPIIFKVECLNKDCIVPCSNDSLVFSTGINTNGTVLISGVDPYWHSSIPGANNISILSPGTAPFYGLSGTGGSATLLQNIYNLSNLNKYKAERDFYVCKSGIISFSGKLGISRYDLTTWSQLYNNFNIYKNGVVVWSHTTGSVGSVGTYETNNFSGTLTVTPGKYTFVFEYNKASSSWNYNSMFVTGIITGNVLANNIECCPTNNSTGSTGSTGGIGHTTTTLGSAVQLGNLEDLHEIEDTCGTWGVLKYRDYSESLYTNSSTDTVYQNCGSGVWFDCQYTCKNPSCSLYTETQYFVSATCCTGIGPYFGVSGNSSGFQGDVELRAKCCGKSCGSKRIYVKILPCPSSIIVSNGIMNGQKTMMNITELKSELKSLISYGHEIQDCIVQKAEGGSRLLVTTVTKSSVVGETIEIPLIEENGFFMMQGFPNKKTMDGGKLSITKLTEIKLSKKHNYVGHVTLLR